jgi:hypothetical protein
MTLLPSSPARTYSVDLPLIVTELRGNLAWAPKTLPVRR